MSNYNKNSTSDYEQYCKNIAYDLGQKLERRGDEVFLGEQMICRPISVKKFWVEVYVVMNAMDPIPWDRRIWDYV